MSKLIPDRTVCWVDQYGGHHVGVTFLNEGLREGDESTTLVRHKHTGELEYVDEICLHDYPMEPIPEPGKDSIVDQLLEKDRQGCEDMAEAMINRFRQDKIPEPGDIGSCSGGASQPAYDGPATDHPKVDFGYPPGIRKFAAGDHGLLTGDEARKRNIELAHELKNLEDWKQAFEAAKKTGVVQVKDGMLSNEQIKAVAKAQLDDYMNNRMASTPTWPRETDLAWEEDCEKDVRGQRIHVLTMEDRLKLEEASARRAEKIARIKAMEESLAKWQPVKPKLSDLYRGNQTLCIGVMPE